MYYTPSRYIATWHCPAVPSLHPCLTTKHGGFSSRSGGEGKDGYWSPLPPPLPCLPCRGCARADTATIRRGGGRRVHTRTTTSGQAHRPPPVRRWWGKPAINQSTRQAMLFFFVPLVPVVLFTQYSMPNTRTSVLFCHCDY